jgi:hypothetical protein
MAILGLDVQHIKRCVSLILLDMKFGGVMVKEGQAVVFKFDERGVLYYASIWNGKVWRMLDAKEILRYTNPLKELEDGKV